MNRFPCCVHIHRGQAKITIHTESHKRQYPKLFDARKNALAKELGTCVHLSYLVFPFLS